MPSDMWKTIRFAIIVCLGCSVLVSGAAMGLRDLQEANLQLDIRKNILKSVGLLDPHQAYERAEVQKIYDDNVKGLVVDADGNLVEGRSPEDLDSDKEPELLPLYERMDGGKVVAYTFPVEGKGLWSTLYGYLALDADLVTVRGITFYKHGETPGLGAEIEKDWFQKNYVGKKILSDDGELVSVSVAKGKAEKAHPKDVDHWVDGISGATITSNGVTDLVRAGLERYEPFFQRYRGKETT